MPISLFFKAGFSKPFQQIIFNLIMVIENKNKYWQENGSNK